MKYCHYKSMLTKAGLVLLLQITLFPAVQIATAGVMVVRLKVEAEMRSDGAKHKLKAKKVKKRNTQSQGKLKKIRKEIEIRKLNREIRKIKVEHKNDELKYKRAGEKKRQLLKEKMVKDESLIKHYQQQVQELSSNKSKLIWTAITAVSVLVVIIFLIIALKKKSIKSVRNEKDAAMIAMRESQKELGKIRDDQLRKKEIPNMLLEGETPEGESILIKLSGELLGRKEGLIIGRNPAMSTYIIDHPEVSRKHFRLIMVSEQLMIEDLGSTNGVKLDGEQIDAHELEVLLPDTEISMGDLKLDLHHSG